MRYKISALVSILLSLSFLNFAQAAVPAAKDQASGQDRAQEMLREENKLRQKIEQPKESPKIEEQLPPQVPQGLPADKVMINKIAVEGVTLVTKAEIDKIIAPFEGKEQPLSDLEKATAQITDLYRKRGFITSQAYISPQKIEGGNLLINVVEGVTGNIEVKGNKYFKADLYQKMIPLQKGQPFNYNTLKDSLARINQEEDRHVKTILTPGKEPASTDIVLETTERFPLHAGFEYDNFGSRFTGRDRLKNILTNNNLLGLDDILEVQYQFSEAENYTLLSTRYLLPVTDTLKLGFYAARTKSALQKEYEDLMARGKSKIYSLYAIQSIINEDNIELSLNAGFDYKDIYNFILGEESSRDRLRVAKFGIDCDISDNFGRTLLSNEFDYGIPDAFGGLKKVDAHASRTGAGGKFVKDTLNLIRLQRMPYDQVLLVKNQFQFSPYILTAAEQFQIGGIVNVRGYPPAELVGDRGYAGTLEWSFPAYFIPKQFKVPLSKAKAYDAVRLAGFYDLATTRLKKTQAGEKKNRTLRSAGCGLRINLPEDFTFRIDWAWPLDNTPSDGKNLHTWTQVTKKF